DGQRHLQRTDERGADRRQHSTCGLRLEQYLCQWHDRYFSLADLADDQFVAPDAHRAPHSEPLDWHSTHDECDRPDWQPTVLLGRNSAVRLDVLLDLSDRYHGWHTRA